MMKFTVANPRLFLAPFFRFPSVISVSISLFATPSLLPSSIFLLKKFSTKEEAFCYEFPAQIGPRLGKGMEEDRKAGLNGAKTSFGSKTLFVIRFNLPHPSTLRLSTHVRTYFIL